VLNAKVGKHICYQIGELDAKAQMVGLGSKAFSNGDCQGLYDPAPTHKHTTTHWKPVTS